MRPFNKATQAHNTHQISKHILRSGFAILLVLSMLLAAPASAAAEENPLHILGAYQSGDKIHVYVSGGSEFTGYLVSAFYSETGRMTDINFESYSMPWAELHCFKLDNLSDGSGQVFLLDENFQPLAAAAPVQRDVITAKEFCAMLSNVVAEIGEAYLAAWQEVAATALQSDLPLTYQLAMICTYEAACVLGAGVNPTGDWLANADHSWDNMRNYSDCWPNIYEEAPFVYPTDYDNGSVHFAGGQTSYGDGKPVFDFPWEQASEYFMAGITREHAQTLVNRFRDSLICLPKYADTDTVNAILREAEQRRTDILDSSTTVTPESGTAYYVSNSSGGDGNNGLSPETAWQTINHVNMADLKPGDTVYFNRGDIWRGTVLYCKEGVTYSAYGEGPKPRFYGSSEHGVGEDKWTLYYEGENGAKIWKFYRDLPDTGGVVFNGGESWATRVYTYWDVDRQCLLKTDDYTTVFTPETCLTENLSCASMIDFSGLSYPINVYDQNRTGAFYLRCDEGNPGVLFNEVEFSTTEAQGWVAPIFCAPGCTIDNLSVLYFGNCGIQAGPNLDNVTVQNCEVGWGGNRIHCYFEASEEKPYWLSGDGIYGVCDSGTVSGNYVHHTGGITFESSPDTNKPVVTGACVIEENLVEFCGAGITLCDPMDYLTVQTMLVKDNLILETGYEDGYSQLRYIRNGIFVADSLVQRCTTLEIIGNTVYGSDDNPLCLIPDENITLQNNSFYAKAR